MGRWILGMDIGGTNIRIGKIDERYKISDFVKVKSKAILTGDESLSNLIELLDMYLGRHADKSKYPSAISIGFPATVDREKRYVVSGPNVKGIDKIRIVDIFTEKYKCPVFIDKDVNMLVSYDIHELGIKSDNIIIACYLGTGFGNAIVINNKIYSGYSGSAGELGHIPVLGKSDICGCGNEGCIENYTGGKQLELIRDKYFPKTNIRDIFSLHGNDSVVEQFIEALSLPIAAEINILDPEYIIIGGGVAHMKKFPPEKLEKYIRKHTRKPFPEQMLQIKYSSQKQENGVIGAGIYAFKRLNDKSNDKNLE